MLIAAERIALVLRLLAKEEPAARDMRVVRGAWEHATSHCWREQFIEGGATRVVGNGSPMGEAREIGRLKRQVAKRDQVIGELTIVNRLLGVVRGDDIA